MVLSSLGNLSAAVHNGSHWFGKKSIIQSSGTWKLHVRLVQTGLDK